MLRYYDMFARDSVLHKNNDFRQRLARIPTRSLHRCLLLLFNIIICYYYKKKKKK